MSAAGNWLTHLTRAHSILQASGGPNALRTPRFRSQVAMLVWYVSRFLHFYLDVFSRSLIRWDATLALISRQGTVFDQTYRDFLIKWEQKDEWSFFELTGCPGDLLVHLFYLAELAKQKELASSMEWLTFNMTPIKSIERKVIEWKNEMIPHVVENDHQDEQEEEKQIHDHQDRYHCAEAWRYSLLIYVERVFKWDRQQRRRPYSIAQLVRTTLDHVRSCCRTSQTQKQLLLPVFLAGSETTDADMRRLVKGYCKHWAEKSRYGMFYSASLLLDEIWMASPSQWWGAVIDQKTRISTGPSQMVTQFLFG